MKAILKYTLLGIFCLTGLSSCKISNDDIRIDEFEGLKLEGITLSQARIKLNMTVANDSRARLKVWDGNLTVSDKKGQIAEILLDDPMVLRSKSSTVITLPLIIRFNGALGSATAIPRLSANPEGLLMNGSIRVKGGMMGKKFKIKDMPVADFLEMLGVSDLKSLNLSL